MQSDNPNKEQPWKHRLDELDSLPGQPFDKESAWEKLQNRRQQKKGKKMLWLYVAAASFIAILFLVWFSPLKKENMLVEKGEKNLPVEKIISPEIIPAPADSKSPAAETRPEIKSVVRVKIFQEKTQPVVTNERIKPGVKAIIITTTPPLEKSDSIQNLPEPLVNVASTVAARRKLPVVHINELGDMPQPVITAGKTDRHSFQLKFGKQEIYTDPSLPNARLGFPILSTKNSPN